MKSLLLFCGLLWTCSLSGQDTWNLQMPFTSLTLDFQGLAEENGQYLLHTNWNVLEVDHAGGV